ncbi:MAG: hypothetical protein WCK35_15155 [Chloroflexota bacterium]
MLFLATPYLGRAIPCDCISYSSKTINDEVTSRNHCHFQAFTHLKKLLGEKPLVLDLMIAYSIILILGETLRQNLFLETSRKYKAYSGPFILIKFNRNLPRSKWKVVLGQTNIAYQTIISPVRSHL